MGSIYMTGTMTVEVEVKRVITNYAWKISM